MIKNNPKSGLADMLVKNIEEYESRYINNPSKKQDNLWTKIKYGIDAIIASQKPPYVSKNLEKPLVLFATPEITGLRKEIAPLAPIFDTVGGGGLGQIAGALVTELYREGVNIKVVFPEYEKMFRESYYRMQNKPDCHFEEEYNRMRKDIRESIILLIESDLFRSADRVYADGNAMLSQVEVYKANAFQRGINSRLLPTIKRLNECTIVHCNDWTTGLIPAAAKSMGMMSLMTFHNTFSSQLSPEELKKQGIDIEPYWHNLFLVGHPDNHGDGTFSSNYRNNKVDLLASGLFSADLINAVSPTFLKEIVNDYFMHDGIISVSTRNVIKKRNNQNSAAGILNAPKDTADPRIDPFIDVHYWIEEDEKAGIKGLEEGKRLNKQGFQRRMGLREDADVPIFFWPSRLADPQKGAWLLKYQTPYLLEKFNLQIAMVADGSLDLINNFQEYQRRFPGRVAYHPFHEPTSRLGLAGSDFILMPSMYEPCGIPQLESPRYGTLAVARQTGGLADSIEQVSDSGLIGNGFLFADMDYGGLWHGIESAVKFYGKGAQSRNNVLKRIIKESFRTHNITNTARQYINLYNIILERRGIKERVV